VKLTFDATNLDADPLNPTASSVVGASCTGPSGGFTYVCEPTSTSFFVTVTTRSEGLSSSLDLSAVLTAGSQDCAVDHESVEIFGGNSECSITAPGVYCYNPTTGCFDATCSARKRATTLVRTHPFTYSLRYRRVKEHSGRFQNSHESDCGPRISILINGRVEFASPESEFLSEGVVSYDSVINIPDGSFSIDFAVEPTDCDHSRILVWDEVREVSGQFVRQQQVDNNIVAAKQFAEVSFK
jgi:hypothetical protein